MLLVLTVFQKGIMFNSKVRIMYLFIRIVKNFNYFLELVKVFSSKFFFFLD